MSYLASFILLNVGIALFIRWDNLQSQKKNLNEIKAREQQERKQKRITELEERVQSLESEVEERERKALIEKIKQEQERNQFPKQIGQYYKNSLSVTIHLRGIGIRWKEISATIPYDMYDSEQYQLAITHAKSLTKKEALSLIKKRIEYLKSLVIKEFSGNPKIQILKGRYGPYIKSGRKNYRIPRNQDPELLSRAECELLIENSRKTYK